MSLFAHVPAAPPDAIYHLTTACNEDPNPDKLNLGVGVYKDADGGIPVLETVKSAEEQIWQDERTKNYLPIDGSREFGRLTRELLLGTDSELAAAASSFTLQSPGGTGALRLAFELISQQLPDAAVWISDPTWANHGQLCAQAGIESKSYPYYDSASLSLDHDAFLASLWQVPAGDAVLLHGCCHNPTGVDPDAALWQEIARLAERRGFLPVIDMAYQGFGQGLDKDAQGLRTLAAAGLPLLVCSSYSKNFGVYKERVGALSVLGFPAEQAAALQSQFKVIARTLWSSPPAHGSRVVEKILSDPTSRAAWEQELARMRNRINDMRHLLAETMQEQGAAEDFSFLTRQYGLFSLTGIRPEVNEIMRQRDSIYFMSTGRINVAGLTPDAITLFCRSYLAATA